MTISFHSASQTSSTECLLPREPLLSPPSSHHSSKDVPFKAEEGNRVSLNMRRKRRSSHDASRQLWQQAFNGSEQDVRDKSQRRRKKQKRSVRRSSMQRSVSLPLLQPRLTHGTIELLSHAGSKRRPRRWTVSSKAPSTRGLASILPADPGEQTRRLSEESLRQSPAMITLRRATTSTGPRRMSLTSFPPPQFGRYSNGFLSSFLNSIMPKEPGDSNQQPSFSRVSTESHRLRSALIRNTEAQPCVSTTAPVVCTELIMMGVQGSNSSGILKCDPQRRCSTRFVSDDNVYEILWEEDASSTSSEGLTIPKIDQCSSDERRISSAVDELQSQLSRASTRRNSVQVAVAGSRREAHDDENQSQALLKRLANSQVSRFIGGKLLQDLPGTKASRAEQWKSCVSQGHEDGVRERQLSQSGDNNGNQVDFFPPVRGRADT
ncbi:uncharacterized protein A1O9_03864, partial [Exophiala aquamarina CBS 119918]